MFTTAGISTSVPQVLTDLFDLDRDDLVANISCFGNETDIKSCGGDPKRLCPTFRSAAVRCIGKYRFTQYEIHVCCV